jgi:DNA recombination protein RmuC
VVEIAGMLEHCDFYQQESVDTEEGKLRPDMVVRLPGKKSIIVDSKAVLHAYLEAAQTEDEALKKEFLLQHANHIRARITELSRKSYWEQFEESPEFVVLFLPGESFFSSALEVSPMLIEDGVSEKVILATPTTLIALLKAVSYGWKQAALTENATQISQLGKELYKRLLDMRGHFEKLGSQLSSSVDSYNKTMASYETRVLVSARRFKDLKSIDGNDELDVLEPIEKTTRALSIESPKES